MDPINVESTGVWADVPGPALDRLNLLGIDPMAAIHAACQFLRHFWFYSHFFFNILLDSSLLDFTFASLFFLGYC
jgi:hypothetical protein